MEPKDKDEKPVSLVAAVTSRLALALMQRQLDKGMSIEIPSLGIVIRPMLPSTEEKKDDLRELGLS